MNFELHHIHSVYGILVHFMLLGAKTYCYCYCRSYEWSSTWRVSSNHLCLVFFYVRFIYRIKQVFTLEKRTIVRPEPQHWCECALSYWCCCYFSCNVIYTIHFVSLKPGVIPLGKHKTSTMTYPFHINKFRSHQHLWLLQRLCNPTSITFFCRMKKKYIEIHSRTLDVNWRFLYGVLSALFWRPGSLRQHIIIVRAPD